jgi:DNA-binding transcriptional ArsR family regulator
MEDEMTVSGPRVRDFTGDAGRFPVEIVASPVFELLMSLFAYSAIEDGSLADFAAGNEWHQGVVAQSSPELTEALASLAGSGEIWIALLGTTLELPSPRSIDQLVRHLREVDPVEFRLQTIIQCCIHCGDAADADQQERAAAGDQQAIDAVISAAGGKTSPGVTHLLQLEASAAAELIASTIEWFERDVFHGGGDIVDVLERDAEHKRAMANTMDAPQLVETATNGITFEMQSEVDGIVLIPSVVVRPWVTIGSHRRKRIFCYPVAEEHLTADADSPPMHLVDVYKALGDERRLQLLRFLAEGPTSLADLTERIGMAKSTVHHHLSLLRQAGLVLITLGTDKAYSLRDGAIPEAADLLAGFLTNSQGAKK